MFSTFYFLNAIKANLFPLGSMELPVFELLISESEDSSLMVDVVSLVDKPAIEKNFLAFKDEKQCFATNEEMRIISGPAMIADKPIYRNADKNMPEHLVVFRASTILSIAQKFFSKGLHNQFNLMHDPNLKAEDVFVFESFIVDDKRGIKPMAGYEDAPNGSWFLSAKVNNNEVWAKIKNGEIKGFSVEGLFKYQKEKMSEQKAFEQILQILNNIE